MNIDPLFPFCQAEIKDADHLFLYCNAAQDCWRLATSHRCINTNFMFSRQLTVLQMLSTAGTTSPTVKLDRVVALLWSTWKIRNSMIFGSETPNLGINLIRAKKVSVEWSIRHRFTQTFHPSNPNLPASNRKKTHWVAWRKPRGGFIKINFDGSKSSQGTVGDFIIRNWEGKFIQVATFKLGVSSVLVAEATTMRNGIKVAVQTGFANVHIEGDNNILIQAVLGRVKIPWEIQVLIQDITTYLSRFDLVIINHIFR